MPKKSFQTNLVLSFLVGLFFLISCAHTDNQALNWCRDLDWYELGRRNGSQGLRISEFNEQISQCKLGNENQLEDQFITGYNSGLATFCTRESGLEYGKTGQNYENVCPSTLESLFVSAYELGKKIHSLEMENDEIKNRIRQLSQEISITSSSSITAKTEIAQLKKRLGQNETAIKDLISTVK